MIHSNKLLCATLAGLLLCTVFTGCGSDSEGNNEQQIQTMDAVSIEKLASSSDSQVCIQLDDEDKNADWDDANATHIGLNSSSVKITGGGANADGANISITDAGTYVISGTLEDGCILVNTEDEESVRLVLNNTSITSKSTAPILVENAKKVIITLAEGSTNTIIDSVRTTSQAEEYSAAIYSKDDLVMNGTGVLNIRAGYRNGIKSNNDLNIVSGTFHVDSAEDGIVGKDFVGINGGDFTISAGDDGIKSTYDTDTSKGNVVIEGGTFSIKSGNDGLQAENILVVNGGTYDITAGSGSKNAADTHTENNKGGLVQSDESLKGLKAVNNLYIYSGNITIDAEDDGLHTNGGMYVQSGDIVIQSGGDGMHADKELTIDGGNITVEKSYEGIEGKKITVNGGDINITSSDDGMNATDGSSTDTGMRNASTDSDIALVINAGRIYIDASGDGLDSNNTLTINGGDIVVCGPVDNNNCSIDFERECTINGGTLMAFGSSGMLETPTNVTNGCCIVTTFSSVGANSEYVLTDSSKNVILSYKPSKSYASAIVYSADIKTGNTYTVMAGSQTQEVTVSQSITGGQGAGGFGERGQDAGRFGEGGFGGGNRGGFDGGTDKGGVPNGEMPTGFEMPHGGRFNESSAIK